MNDSAISTFLRELYIKDPCIVLANALWKTLDRLDNLEFIASQAGDNITQLEAWDNQGLHVLWNEAREISDAYIDRVENSNFAIIHNDYFQKINKQAFKVTKPYFRIQHDCKVIGTYTLSERFSIVNVNIESELDQVSELICKCYKDIRPSSGKVEQWTKTRVFDNNLWIWIVDKMTSNPIALGIADLDKSLPEGSLEWIQVLPEYQGKGLGKVLVFELLSRMHGKVDLVTVSGEVDNLTNPEWLYRSCGFVGNDIWWLLRK